MLGIIDEEIFSKMAASSYRAEWRRLVQTDKLWEQADWNPKKYQKRIANYKADPL